MRRVFKNLCPTTISASIMATNLWKSSLKNVESVNNKILYENLLDFFLQRDDTYFLNKPCSWFSSLRLRNFISVFFNQPLCFLCWVTLRIS